MSGCFDHEAGEFEEFQTLRRQMQAWEKEYLEIRVLLWEAEIALREDQRNAGLKAKVDYLRQRQADLESKSRLAEDYPLEVALFASPHG
ncbi:MAG: hypothetical protein A2Y80_04150 [Deltaproteobacteria bacterium RBG_13_58_19]|nr:MAG: hypothetical protein A2Y80_04150 [Deltaproteobacteria bacterium RBG_13_58_19]